MPKFDCPICGVPRQSADSDCGACGWKRRSSEPTAEAGARCILCGHMSFSWGRVVTQWGIRWKSDDAGLLEQLTPGGGEQLTARKCNRCGNVQLFAQ